MKVKALAAVALIALGTTSTIALAASPTSAPDNNVQQQLATNLQNSGFSHVQLTPDAFLVKATDKSGDPVDMYITPDSMTELVTNVSDMHATPTADTHAAATTSGDSMFLNLPAKDELTSKVVGIDVFNNDKKSIGQIKDVAFDSAGQLKGYVLSVGGFLGIDSHYVAVRPSAVNLTWNADNKAWHAEMNTTADQLKAAPAYKYNS
jgi:hypothetical protein